MKKSAIVFLRGFSRDHRHWGEFIPKVKSSFSDAEVFTPDLPGFGFKNDINSPTSIEEIADSVYESEGYEDFHNRYENRLIFGLSLGGMVSLELARKHPHLWTGCILANSSQKKGTYPWERVNLRYLPQITDAFLRGPVERREALLFDVTTTRKFDKEKVVNDWVKFYKDRPCTLANILAHLRASSSFAVDFKIDAKVKGLIMASRDDKLVKSSSSRKIAKLLNWSLETNIQAGHDITHDDPYWVIDTIKRCFPEL